MLKILRLLAGGSLLASLYYLVWQVGLRWKIFELEQGKLLVWSSLPVQLEEAAGLTTLFFLVGFFLFMFLAGRRQLGYWDGTLLIFVTGAYFCTLIIWGQENWKLAFGLSGWLWSLVFSGLAGLTTATLLLALVSRLEKLTGYQA